MPEEAPTPEATPEKNLGLLAQEVFGSEFHGEVKETPEPEKVEPEEEEQPPVEAQPESSEIEEQIEIESPESEDTPVSTIQELIESSEFDPEWFYSLEAETSIDGETHRVKIKDALNLHKDKERFYQEREQEREKAKSQHQALAQKKQELDQAINFSSSILLEQKATLDAKQKALNENPLRQQDPAEWAALNTELEAERKAFDNKLIQFHSAHQQMKQKEASELEQSLQQRVEAEQIALQKEFPEWENEEEREKTQKALSEYLGKAEVSQDSLTTINLDHKLFIMARKAMLYDEIKSKAEPAKKKLNKVPKVLKPGSQPPSADINQTKIDELQAKIDANPNSREALEYATQIVQLRRGTT